MHALVALILLATNSANDASIETGETLLRYLDDQSEQTAYMHGVAEGYVVGVNDGLLMSRAICENGDVTRGQVIDVVIKYLKDNPAKRQLMSRYAVINAVGKVWPCNTTIPEK